MPSPSPSLISDRYERLCQLSDEELRHSLQALNLNYSAFAVSPFDPIQSETLPALDAFSPLTPSPPCLLPLSERTWSPNVNEFDCHNLPTAVLSSLMKAAFNTRTPIKTSNPLIPQPIHATPTPPGRSSPVEKPSQSPTPTLPAPSNVPLKSCFQTARSRLVKSKSNTSRNTSNSNSNPPYQRPLISSSSTPTSYNPGRSLLGAKRPRPLSTVPQGNSSSKPDDVDPDIPEVPNVDPKLVQLIMNETLEKSPGVDWDDIAGLQFAKQCVMEAVVWPMLRPDIFSGLRGPPKGLLLFGPPGTGKTMIGRAIASKSGAKFFNISASSLVSKWAGEGEKTVRALFGVARLLQPSVVFIDEIDSLLTQRSDGEQEHSRRMKTEFLVQMDGAGTSREDRVLVVGATNRPGELDEAARRRLVKRLYIPLPDKDARCSLIERLMHEQSHSLSQEDIKVIAKFSEGYSGSDMYALCAEAALGPVRDLGARISSIDVNSVRAVNIDDFRTAARMVRASVSDKDLDGYVEWNESFGSFPMKEHKVESNGSEELEKTE